MYIYIHINLYIFHVHEEVRGVVVPRCQNFDHCTGQHAAIVNQPVEVRADQWQSDTPPLSCPLTRAYRSSAFVFGQQISKIIKKTKQKKQKLQ